MSRKGGRPVARAAEPRLAIWTNGVTEAPSSGQASEENAASVCGYTGNTNARPNSRVEVKRERVRLLICQALSLTT